MFSTLLRNQSPASARAKTRRRPKLRLTSLEDRVNPAGSLVVDINVQPETYGGYPSDFTEVNGTLFFVAGDRTHGRELWKSDGTPGGTTLVKDIAPTFFYGYGPLELTDVNGTLFFTADDGEHGRELWKSDGTAAGTVLVKDINTTTSYGYASSSTPQRLTNLNGTLFFVADDGVKGRELWKSDGTEAGTLLVKDIDPSPYSNYGGGPAYLTASGSTLYFAADDGSNGMELWKSDGTTAGTQMVADTNSGSSSSYPTDLVDVNGTLYFVADDGIYGRELWTSDGTAGGTGLVADITSYYSGPYFAPRSLTNVDGTLFFVANNITEGRELWTSDGTSAGTQLVKDIQSYPYIGSYPIELTAVGSTLYFTANDGVNGQEIWKSDGTSAGTVLVVDIDPYLYSYGPDSLTNVDGTLYFAADDGVGGRELWKSDGTSAGTALVKNIRPDSLGGYPYSSDLAFLTAVGGTLFFTANDGATGQELWFSDGTEAGTSLAKDIYGGTLNGYPTSLTDANGTLYFVANDGDSGPELWISDGTAAGTTLAKDINPGSIGSSPFELRLAGSTVFFAADDGVNGRELWASDGTEAGTFMVKDISPGSASSFPHELVVMNGTLYFTASDGVNGAELWKSDGTAAGTVMVANIDPSSGSGPRYTVVVGNSLFFSASDNINGRELWVSDGTPVGTTLLRNIQPGLGSSYPQNLTELNGSLLFTANDPSSGVELWITDGTTAGTAVLKDLDPGVQGTFPLGFVRVDDLVFFSAGEPTNGRELWVTDGTEGGTGLVLDIVPGSFGSYPYLLGGLNGRLFFSAPTDGGGEELWTSDGTAAGTAVFKEINPGAVGSYPLNMTELNGTLYFSATSAEFGTELWKSDGTAAGTVLDTDAAPGPANSAPRYLTPTAQGVFFTAVDEPHGRELWFSLSAPSVTMNQAAAQNDPVLAGPILFTAVFSEPVSGFTSADVDMSASTAGGTLTAAVTESGPMDGTTYTVSVSGMNDDGAVIVSIVAGAAQNGASVPSLASTWTDNTVVFVVPPTVTIEQGAAQNDPVTNGPIVFDVVFSEAVTGFTPADVDLSASTVGGSLVAAVIQLTPSTYTVQVTGMVGEGTVAASIPAAVVQDSSANFNLASSSNDNVVVFAVPPTVVIEQAASQADPVTSGPIVFDVIFSEAVTGFNSTDVDLSASSVGGSLSAVVIPQSPSVYRVEVTGMVGAGTVAASIPAGAAQDSLGVFNLDSTSIDNVVTYSGFGSFTLNADSFAASEGGADVVVTVTRSGGLDGEIAFNYAFTNLTASPGDYSISVPLTGSLQWLEGESDVKSFTIAIADDSVSEIEERFRLTLSSISGSAQVGLTETTITIARNDPKPLNAGTKFTQKFTEPDGDIVTVKLTGDKTGSANIFLTNDSSPIGLIDLSGTNSAKAKLSISVKKNKLTGDGSVKLTQVTGTGLKSLTGKSVVLDTIGMDLGSNYLGSLTVGSIANGADVKAGGTNLQKTRIKTGAIRDGTDIVLGSILSNLSATSMGDGSIVVPSAGTIMIKGSFGADVTISGAGVDHTKGKKSLNKLNVKGIVDGSDISVVGNIGAVSVFDFLNSRLFGGYTGPDNGVGGAFNAITTTIGSFKTAKNVKLGLTGKFRNSSVIADNIKTASLADVIADNLNDPFGIFVNDGFKTVTVTIDGTKTILKNGAAFPASGDFDVNVV